MIERAGSVLESFLAASSEPDAKFREDLAADQIEKMAETALVETSRVDMDPAERATALLALCASVGVKLHSPNYMGHQVPPPIPAVAAAEALIAGMNQGLAVNELSPFASAMERVMIRRLRQVIGWTDAAVAGICTSGGTLANTTAILAARNRAFPKAWKHGITREERPVLMTSIDSHYSIARSMGVLGLGTENLVTIPVDDRRRMRVDRLESSINQQRDSGGQVFCVVASAPATPAGSIDDIDAIADVCERLGVWLHVDAVHGASFLFSEHLKSRMRGIHRADSVAWDAHKMLHVPSLCTFLLYRNLTDSFLAFENRASYLFDDDDQHRAVQDGAKRTFECTKRALAAPLWFVWALYGHQAFAEICERCVWLAEKLYSLLDESTDFQVPYVPDSNIVCFRYAPTVLPLDTMQLNDLQQRIRQQLLAERDFYLTQTTIDGQIFLRTTLINPLTEDRNLLNLLTAIRRIGGRALGGEPTTQRQSG
jgi:L-2,4-diaminobutyrate decarboxylase